MIKNGEIVVNNFVRRAGRWQKVNWPPQLPEYVLDNYRQVGFGMQYVSTLRVLDGALRIYVGVPIEKSSKLT